jgi:hypothetical protein
MSTLDLFVGMTRKEAGMEAAARNRSELLVFARQCALDVAQFRHDRTCTSDMVAAKMALMGASYDDLGNAAGSIFKGNQWRFTGEYTKSQRPTAHARDIKIWKLNNTEERE